MPTTKQGLDVACRGKITIAHVGQAVQKLQAMDLGQKEQLADEIAREQPALFSSFLTQKRFRVSFEKMEFLLNILFVCYLAMKETELSWPKITNADVDANVAQYVERVKFAMDIDAGLRQNLVQQFVEDHPEQALLAYVQTETASWLKRVPAEDSDRHVMLTAVTMVNCIAYAAS